MATFAARTQQLCCALLLLLPLLVVAQTTPVKVACPKTLIRSTGPASRPALSTEERNYVSARTDTVLPGAWKTYLSSVKSALPRGGALPAYVSDILDPKPTRKAADFPKLGIALSGGGLRAAYFAAGVLTALDARNTTHPTGTNGVLQAATYLAGLSGGAWFTTALVQADFPTVPELVFPAHLDLDLNVSAPAANSQFGGFLSSIDILGPGGADGDNTAFIGAILAELSAKHSAGFPVTLTDAWTRMIARHFVNGTTADDLLLPGLHGDGITFSGLQNVPTIKAHAQPFPIILANAIPPALIANPNDPAQIADTIPGNSVPVGSEIWEINMFETGSWDPSLGSFIPTRLLGSSPASGAAGRTRVPAQCVNGFDQAAYIAGLSSNVFNGLNGTTNLLPFTTEGAVINIIEATFPPQTPVRMDSGAVPNPFRGVNPGKFSASQESFVALVDGGSNGEVLPLQPLIMKTRGVDTIFAVDAPADLPNSFTNGSDLINTAARAARFGDLYPFPRVPSSPQTFIAQNLTLRPTFFGCSDADARRGAPLVVYVANGGPSAQRRALGLGGVTDVPTAVTQYSDEMAQAFMDESFAIATQGLGLEPSATPAGAQWSTCLACALVDRARGRKGVKREGVCVSCFENYCWDGKE